MFSLRPYQQDAVDNTLADLKDYNRLGLILPTGSGKTEIFIEIIKSILERDIKSSVLVLSHLDILTTQTYERFKLRSPNTSVGILKGRDKPYWTNRVVISTMQTSRSEANIDLLNEILVFPVKYIIIDEAHYLYTTSYDKALSYFPDAKVIGCTATPFRSSQIMTNFFDKISYSTSLQDMIDKGYLVKPYLHQIRKRGDDLEEIISTILNIYKKNEMGRQSIIYMKTIDDAHYCRNAFDAHGISARAVTSKMVGEYRDDVLNSFRKGRIKVLTTVNVLSAGFDAPNIQSIFQPYATKSPTLYLQRIGRGLRTCDKINKSRCDIYVFGDAPSIASKMYEVLHTRILNKGGRTTEYPTYKDDIVYNDYDRTSEVYIWTQEIVNAIDQMHQLKMHTFAEILNNKKFPPKFMKNIQDLIKRLPSRASTLRSAPITPKQMGLLIHHGFNRDQIVNIKKGEASDMISAIMIGKNIKSNDFIMPNGRHQGKHIMEVPHAYRQIVKSKFPNSEAARLIRKWEQYRRQA